MLTHSSRFGLAAIATLAVAAAHATIAYSNLAPAYDWSHGSGWTITGLAASTPQTIVHQFKSLATGSLDSVLVVLGHVAGTNIGAVYLYKDSGLNTLGDYMCSWSFNPLPDFNSGSGITVLSNSFPEIGLVAGDRYWVRCDALANDADDAWNFNVTGASGRSAVSFDGGTNWRYMDMDFGAFEVNVVPEPALWAALGIGFLAFLQRRLSAGA